MTGGILLFSILLSALSDCAYALAVGAVLAALWLQPLVPPTAIAARKWLLSASLLSLFALLLRPWFLAASMSGSTHFREVLAVVPDILSSTHQGLLWKIGIAATLALLAGTLVMQRSLRAGAIVTALALGVLAFLKAATSHAADDGDFTRLELLQWTHILATALWAGGVITSGLLVLPALKRSSPQEDIAGQYTWRYSQNLSVLATYAVLIVLATGLYTGNKELMGPLSTLWNSAWGRILTAKVILVTIAVVLGGMNRFLCLRGEPSPEKLARLRRLLSWEALTILAVLCLSGWLGNTAPMVM